MIKTADFFPFSYREKARAIPAGPDLPPDPFLTRAPAWFIMSAGQSEASMKRMVLAAVLAVVLFSSTSCLLGTTVHFNNKST